MAEGPNVNPQKPEPARENPGGEQPPAAPTIIAIVQIPQAIIEQYVAKKEEREPREKWKFRLQWLTLIFVAIATFATLYQGYLVRKTSEAATSAARTAKQAMTASIEASRTDQRAWIGPKETKMPSISELQEGGQGFLFGINLYNSGKTPALEVRSAAVRRLLPKETRFEPLYTVRPGYPESVYVVFPGSYGIVTAPRIDLGKREIAAIKDGSEILYLYGKVEYQDISKATVRHTTFCFWLKRDLSGFSPCDTYNTAD